MTNRQRIEPMALPQRHQPSNLTRIQPAPEHLEKPERDLWVNLIRGYRFDDEGSLELLQSALEARMRSRRCRISIDKEGEVWRDDKGNLRPHPLLAAERSARASFIGCMRLLRLDTTGKK
jgi:hypothetical protein